MGLFAQLQGLAGNSRCPGTVERVPAPLIRSVGGHGNLILGEGKAVLILSRPFQVSRQPLILGLNCRAHTTPSLAA